VQKKGTGPYSLDVADLYRISMPRTRRETPGGFVYHVINRGVRRMRLFNGDADYAAFEDILRETLELRPMRVNAFCLMPNHWHFLLWPQGDNDLARFMQRFTITHAARWQKKHGAVGHGHVYQGRYKCFPVQTDEHFCQVARYIERNALRAGLVAKAELWRWSSLWHRLGGQPGLLSDWPISIPRDWLSAVNRAETEAELAALRRSVIRSRPFGSDQWAKRTARLLDLEWTLRPRGRPRKE
jgi:putative transposase